METIGNLQKKFEYYAEQQYIAFSEGGGRKANIWHKKIMKLYEMCQTLKCTDMFRTFLFHENENVRLWAAGFCRNEYPKESMKVLKKLLRSSEPIISLSAKVLLEPFNKKK